MKKQSFKRFFLIPLLILVIIFSAACGNSDQKENKKSASPDITYSYVSPSALKSKTNTSTSGNAQDSSDSPGGPEGMMGGPDTQIYDYSGSHSASTSANGVTRESDGDQIISSVSDENAVLAENGGTMKITNADIKKSGSDENGDNCNFYGLNSSVLAAGSKSKVYISGSTISSASTGSNGIFATDSAKIYANDVKIKTSKGDNSRGIDATYDGTVYGNKLDITTGKEHCAALATDRGGGYISVTNSKLKTAGSGSPLIYSTGDIEIDNVSGTASGSQIAGIEGMNRIVINNSTLESTSDAISGSDPVKNGIILYQSTSGDADTSTSKKAEFQAADSTLKSSITDGAMFYVTNTTAKVVLQNTKLDFDSSKADLINALSNSNNWGNTGSNGGNVSFTCKDMDACGNVKTDSASSIDLYLLSGTSYTGKTKGEITNNNMNVNVSSDSTWTVTGSCTVSDLNVASGGKVTDKKGKTVTIRKGGKTIVKGESSITVTVKGSYNTKVKTGSDTKYSAKVLDRTAFDKAYKTETAFGKNN